MSMEDVEQLLRSYGGNAPESLLFVDIEAVNASLCTAKGTTSMWSVSARREKIDVEELYALQHVTLTHNRAEAAEDAESWRIASWKSTIDILPDDLKEVVPKHRLKKIEVGIALRNSNSNTTAASHKFFSMLPLPTETSLPAHINASFALADDRRSIRFDDCGKSTTEARYNRWLLNELVPKAYLYALSLLPLDQNPDLLLPGATSFTEDPLSRVVMESFYTQHLMQTNRAVCRGVTNEPLRPGDCVFLQDESKDVRTVLDILKPPNLVVLPRKLRKLALTEGAPLINATFLHNVASEGATMLLDAYRDTRLNIGHIEGFLKHLCQLDREQALYLQLLPLANGELGYLTDAKTSPVYVVNWPKDSTPWQLFSQDRFLHPDVSDFDFFVEHQFCEELDDKAILHLMSNLLPKNPKRTTLQEREWIQDFWSSFNYLRLKKISIFNLHLVPTIDEDFYVSIAECEGDRVLPSPSSPPSEAFVIDSLRKLGAIIVCKNATTFPKQLRIFLKDLNFDIIKVLQFLASLSTSVSTLSQKVSTHISSSKEREIFGNWIRSQISESAARRQLTNAPELLEVTYRLPIWPTYCARSKSLRSLFEPHVKILPFNITCAASTRFLTTRYHFADEPPLMQTFVAKRPGSIKSISFSEVVSYLEFPRALSNSDVTHFVTLLSELSGSMLCYPNDLRRSAFRIPNSSGIMVDISSLYSRTQHTFQWALGNREDFFMHPRIEQFETHLAGLGLQQRPNFSTFKSCLDILQEDLRSPALSQDLISRADALYRWYQVLPMEIGDSEIQWEQIRHKLFIRCSINRRQFGDASIDANKYTVIPQGQNHDIVTPAQMLREEHKNIAWTQRALFRVPPESRLLLADLKLGVPSVDEVVSTTSFAVFVLISLSSSLQVDHLFILASRVAIDHPSHGEVLNDLTCTYQWLNDAERYEQAGSRILLKFNDKPLFLNVNDPNLEAWSFCTANRLIVNAPDEGNYQGVRNFLMTFKSLIIASGGHEIKRLEAPEFHLTSAEGLLDRWRSQMSQMQRQHQLTDLQFVCVDGVEFAHRNILAVTSDHFRSEFTNDAFDQGSPSKCPADPATINLEDEGIPIACVRSFLGKSWGATLIVP